MNRNLEGIFGHVISFIGAALSVFVIQIIIFGPLLGYELSLAIFLLFAMSLTFMLYAGGKGKFLSKINIIDWIFVAMTVLAMGYLIVNHQYMLERVEYVSELSLTEYILGIVAIIAVLEATRRAMGTAMSLIALILLLYVMFGQILPKPFGHSGFSFDWIIDTMYLTSRGIFGIPLWIVITLAFPFILYGVILEEMGILRTFLDFANRLLGRTAGAPAKTSIIAGTMVGMASGLPMSTTYLIGFPTIPEMKKVGYPPRTAGAIAAVVGTAAQLMPPMLGVAAFVVAQYMGVPYIKVCQYTLLPALLFYAVFFMTVHFETKKHGIRPHDIPAIPYVKILGNGLYIFIVSIAVLIYFLVQFYPVGLSALYACGVAIVLGVLRPKKNRLTLKMVYSILAKTGRTSVYIAIACAAAGIIIGMLVETGLNLKFANMVILLGRNNLFIAMLLSALAILVMSMGMPSIPAYITGIAIFGPALIELGIIAPVAHIFCFYYATLYSITPPVAFASYAGAQIAEEDPMMTGLVACRLGIMTYIIPFLFAYNPAFLLIPEYWDLAQVIKFLVFVIPGLVIFAAGVSGYWSGIMKPIDRLLALAAGILLLMPSILFQCIGLAMFIFEFFKQDIYGMVFKQTREASV